MAGNLIPLDQAAQMLGLSSDALNEMRTRSEIHGYRDGSSWKFKMEEIQRVADDRGIQLSAASGSAMDQELEEILSDSDMVLDVGDAGESSGTSSVELASGGSDVLSGSDVEPGESTSDTGKMVEGEADDDLLLAEDDLFEDGDLSLSDDDGAEISLDSDSDLESSDLVLDEDSSNEMSMNAGDSGINLSPTDSGLSLEEEPLELSGSDIDSLELPEDDEFITLQDEEGAAQSADVRADDDFMLTPVEDDGEEESSGSQVIALEDSEIYADDTSGVLVGSGSADVAPALVAEDDFTAGPAQGAVGDAQPMGVAMATGPQAPPEAPYSIWNVLSLIMVLGFLTVSCMLAFDVTRNMWNFDAQLSLNNTLMDFVIRMVGLDPA